MVRSASAVVGAVAWRRRWVAFLPVLVALLLTAGSATVQHHAGVGPRDSAAVAGLDELTPGPPASAGTRFAVRLGGPHDTARLSPAAAPAAVAYRAAGDATLVGNAGIRPRPVGRAGDRHRGRAPPTAA